jgi:cell division protein FtsQ
MHKTLNILKGILVVALVLFLYAFSSSRNHALPITDVQIKFVGKNTLYISKSSVDKLLIQNQQPLECVSKEVLDLRGLESKISSHQMIKSVEAYLTVNGEVRLEIEQREPVARVVSEPSFYIDSYGQTMPLSMEHSARVMLVHGNINMETKQPVFDIINSVRADNFLTLNVTDITIDDDSKLSLRLRDCDFDVIIGNIKALDKKLINLKAFYKKAKKDNILDQYKIVNLQFDQQVVCTKNN